jgi:hypothetical protein
MDQFDHQDQMQTNMALTLVEMIRAKATEVIKVIQHTTIQTHACSLSMHSQVEPDGFRSQTTRVRHHVVAHDSLTHRLLGYHQHNLLPCVLLYPIT